MSLGVGLKRSDVRSVDVFSSNEMEPLVACCLRLRLLQLVEIGFPHHIRDAIANLEKIFNNVGGERCGIKS